VSRFRNDGTVANEAIRAFPGCRFVTHSLTYGNLIERGTARTPEEAIHILRQARPKIAVNAVQRKCLDAYHASRGSSNGL
jgi:hypothetical protein